MKVGTGCHRTLVGDWCPREILQTKYEECGRKIGVIKRLHAIVKCNAASWDEIIAFSLDPANGSRFPRSVARGRLFTRVKRLQGELHPYTMVGHLYTAAKVG